jgi:hypothetical protein
MTSEKTNERYVERRFVILSAAKDLITFAALEILQAVLT